MPILARDVSCLRRTRVIGQLPVSEIITELVLEILAPIRSLKTATAVALRGRIEAVLSYAIARGWRDGPNPAMWRGHLQWLL